MLLKLTSLSFSCSFTQLIESHFMSTGFGQHLVIWPAFFVHAMLNTLRKGTSFLGSTQHCIIDDKFQLENETTSYKLSSPFIKMDPTNFSTCTYNLTSWSFPYHLKKAVDNLKAHTWHLFEGVIIYIYRHICCAMFNWQKGAHSFYKDPNNTSKSLTMIILSLFLPPFLWNFYLSRTDLE